MAELTSQTTFTVGDPVDVIEESVELLLLPENVGTGALRELRYPGDVLPPLIYPDDPDEWENFDAAPLTARPSLKGELTIQDAALARWPGYQKDRPVREIWKGADRLARMTLYHVRRFLEYFLNPPASGYITWAPKDLCAQVYYIEIENFTVGGQEVVNFNTSAYKLAAAATKEIVFTFRIVGVVP